MATQYLAITEFTGIDQAGDGNTRSASTSPDAQNFDTRDGNLAVAPGYVKHILAKVPGDVIRRLFIFKGLTKDRFVVVSRFGGSIHLYVYHDTNQAWRSIYTYPSTVVGLKWDAIQCNIGNNDYIIFACGEHQLVMWDGVPDNDAELFGSGDYVLDTTVASYNSTTKTITLAATFTDEIKARMLRLGIVVNGVTLAVTSADATAKTVVLTNAPSTAPTTGQTAKVRGSISNASVNFVAMHFSRMFAAGDPENPTRLYYSQIPGDGRTVEDWLVDSASENTSGGFVEVGDSFGDPIIGLASLSDQLIIYKRYSSYRLTGSTPSTFTISKLDAEVEKISHASITMHGDVPYWMTPVGLYYFNGRTVMPSPDARKIQKFMKSAYIELSKGAENQDILYFSCYEGSNPAARNYDNALVVYDVYRRAYMIRRGFEIADIASHNGTLYMVNGEGYVYRMNEGRTYDSNPINAYWYTQLTDLNRKSQDKRVVEAYLRGTGDDGSNIQLTTFYGTANKKEVMRMPSKAESVIEIRTNADYARTVQFKIENEAGGWFSVMGGVEFSLEVKERAK